MKLSLLTRQIILGACGATFCVLGLSACGEAPEDHAAMLPEDQRVSTVPWNKQQGWENNSQLGALARNPRLGGTQ